MQPVPPQRNQDRNIWQSQDEIIRHTGINPIVDFQETNSKHFQPGTTITTRVKPIDQDGRSADIRQISLALDSNPFVKDELRKEVSELPATESNLSSQERLRLFDKVYPYIKFGVLPAKKDFLSTEESSLIDGSYNGDIYGVVSPEIYNDKDLKKYEIILLLGIISQGCGAKNFIIPDLKTRYLGSKANKLSVYGGSRVLKFLDANVFYGDKKREDLINSQHIKFLSDFGDLRVCSRVLNGCPDAVVAYSNIVLDQFGENEDTVKGALKQLEDSAGKDSRGEPLYRNLGKKPGDRLVSFSPVGSVDKVFDTYLDPETPPQIEAMLRDAQWIWKGSEGNHKRELILVSQGTGPSKDCKLEDLLDQVNRRLIVRPSSDGHNDITIRNFHPELDEDPAEYGPRASFRLVS